MTDGPGVLAANKCEHRFMWVDLQIKHLCAMKIDYEVEKELGKLPGDLAMTYDQIYKRIQDDVHSAPWALKALMWILGAEEPLSPDEWAGGVSWALLRPDGKPLKLEMPVLLDVCQNLVVHDGQQNVMRFAHLSVREFLETKVLDRQAAEMVASACLAILLHPCTLNIQPIASTDFTPFHRYSIRYWPEHVLRCNDPTSQLSSILSAFMGSFVHPADTYIHWLEAATTMSDHDVIDYVFQDTIRRLRSTPPNPLFAAAYFGFKKGCSHLWEPNTFDPNCTNDAQETLLYLASSQGHTATVRLLLQNGADINHTIHRDEKAPLLAAIQGHHSKVLDVLLDAGAKFNSTEYPNIILAGASVGNGAVMQQLLQRDASIKITEAVVIAAARNNSGKEVMQQLMQRDDNIKITEAIVTAVARNVDSGKEVLQQLLQRDANIEITEAAITAAARNKYSGKEVMQLLLQKDASIKVTEAVITAAAGNKYGGKEVMQLLLQRDSSIGITEAVVRAAAGNWYCGEEVMQQLLQRDASIEITEAVVIAAAGNWRSGKDVLQQLLQRDACIEITEAVVTAAAQNEHSGKEVMLLLQQRNAGIKITEAVVTAAAGNRRSGKEVVELILQRDASIEITEAIITAAAGNVDGGKEILQQLLQKDASIKITEAAVTAAAGNRRSGKEVMELLLQRDTNIEITEAVITAAARNRSSGNQVMQLLLQRDSSIEITEAIVTAAAENWRSGKKILQQLLQRDASIEITDPAVTAAAHNQHKGREAMQRLLKGSANFEITEAVVTGVARNERVEVMQQLLQGDAGIEITETAITAAAENEESGEEVMELLLRKDASIEITETIVIAAAGNWRSGKEVMELLLQRDASIEITEAVVTAADRNRGSGKKVMELLLKTERAFVKKSSLSAAAFFGQQEWFERLWPKIDSNSLFAQHDMQYLIAAIEGGDSLILNACLVSSHESNDTDDHGWTLHMVAVQSRNQTAIKKLQDSSKEPMQPMSVTHWEVNPIIFPFVSIGGDGTSLVYSGNLPGFPAEFLALTAVGSFLGSGLSVKGNHPFPPGIMGEGYFEVEVLDSVDSKCVIDLIRCAPTNSSAATCALDSAANTSCIKTCQPHIAARRHITVMEVFGGTMTGTATERNTARGISLDAASTGRIRCSFSL
jgi:predicted acetyltransferase